MILSPRGWATFAWQSDYGQLYLVDRNDLSFRAPEIITDEMMQRGLCALPKGLVIYTNDCLQQHIRIRIFAAEPDYLPADQMSGNPWTNVETIEACFPSRTFLNSSPSIPDPLPAGPVFLLETEKVIARISWMEFQGSRDDSVPVEPDVIEITFWPN